MLPDDPHLCPTPPQETTSEAKSQDTENAVDKPQAGMSAAVNNPALVKRLVGLASFQAVAQSDINTKASEGVLGSLVASSGPEGAVALALQPPPLNPEETSSPTKGQPISYRAGYRGTTLNYKVPDPCVSPSPVSADVQVEISPAAEVVLKADTTEAETTSKAEVYNAMCQGPGLACRDAMCIGCVSSVRASSFFFTVCTSGLSVGQSICLPACVSHCRSISGSAMLSSFLIPLYTRVLPAW